MEAHPGGGFVVVGTLEGDAHALDLVTLKTLRNYRAPDDGVRGHRSVLIHPLACPHPGFLGGGGACWLLCKAQVESLLGRIKLLIEFRIIREHSAGTVLLRRPSPALCQIGRILNPDHRHRSWKRDAVVEISSCHAEADSRILYLISATVPRTGTLLLPLASHAAAPQ